MRKEVCVRVKPLEILKYALALLQFAWYKESTGTSTENYATITKSLRHVTLTSIQHGGVGNLDVTYDFWHTGIF